MLPKYTFYFNSMIFLFHCSNPAFFVVPKAKCIPLYSKPFPTAKGDNFPYSFLQLSKSQRIHHIVCGFFFRTSFIKSLVFHA